MRNKLVLGVGVKDVDYVTEKMETVSYINGKQKQKTLWRCQYYTKWRNLLKRCYSDLYKNKNPTYKNCTVDPDWLYLSNFIKWVDSQPNRNWENCQLDKDFLVEGNKHYGKDICVFVTKGLNLFITYTLTKGESLIGVSCKKSNNVFVTHCRDPFKIENNYVGTYETELEAHKAWQAKKHEYACKLANLQSDERIAEVLRTKYAPDRDWTNR
jgi:hypothetical protein